MSLLGEVTTGMQVRTVKQVSEALIRLERDRESQESVLRTRQEVCLTHGW